MVCRAVIWSVQFWKTDILQSSPLHVWGVVVTLLPSLISSFDVADLERLSGVVGGKLGGRLRLRSRSAATRRQSSVHDHRTKPVRRDR